MHFDFVYRSCAFPVPSNLVVFWRSESGRQTDRPLSLLTGLHLPELDHRQHQAQQVRLSGDGLCPIDLIKVRIDGGESAWRMAGALAVRATSRASAERMPWAIGVRETLRHIEMCHPSSWATTIGRAMPWFDRNYRSYPNYPAAPAFPKIGSTGDNPSLTVWDSPIRQGSAGS